LPLFNIKGNPGALSERFEPRFVDAGMMNEYIWPIFLLDEAISLGIVEPFDCTAGHAESPFFNELIVPLLYQPGFNVKLNLNVISDTSRQPNGFHSGAVLMLKRAIKLINSFSSGDRMGTGRDNRKI